MARGSAQNAVVNVSSATAVPTTLVASRSGYAIRVLGYVLTSNSGPQAAWPDGVMATVQWGDDSVAPLNPLSGVMGLRDGVPLTAPEAASTETALGGYFQTASGAGLVMQASGNITGHLTWCYVAA